MTLRHRIAASVRRPFADPSGRPAVTAAPPDARLLPEGSVAFEVHADVTTMMIGGISSLLMQMLHPHALAGVWDHSNFRTDMAGRLRRTAAFISVTSFGARADAEAALARVRRIHAAVEGRLPDGTPYRASDPRLITFVGVTEALGFLEAFVRYREPWMPAARQNRYFAEMAGVSRQLGGAEVPVTRRDAEALLLGMRRALRSDARTAEVARLILGAAPGSAAMAVPHRLIVGAAIDLLPPWARRLHGLTGAGPATPLLRAGAGGLGAVVRWALKAPRPVHG